MKRSKSSRFAHGILFVGSCLSCATTARAECEVWKFMYPSMWDSSSAYLGRSTAIDGRIAVIGAPYPSGGGGGGAVYVLDLNDLRQPRWSILRPSNLFDYAGFGESVAVSGDLIVVGADGVNCYGSGCGAAYVFRRGTHGWVEEQKLNTPSRESRDRFGSTVAVDGDFVVVGAPFDDCSTSRLDCGAAYVYRFNGSGWVEHQQLIARDSAPGAMFGAALSISGDVLVITALHAPCGVGGCGAAYVFRFDGSLWVQEAKLVLSFNASIGWFGASVSIDNGVFVVGAPNEPCCGAAYVYRFDGSSWGSGKRLVPAHATYGDQYGGSVSIDGDSILIGASGHYCVGCGAAYLYRFDGLSWVEQSQFPGFPSSVRDRFGESVAISGNFAVVGAPYETPPGATYSAGSAHIYQLAPDCNGNGIEDFCDIRDVRSRDIDENWVPDECEPDVPTQCELEKIIGPSQRRGDGFGGAVAVDDNRLVIGSCSEDSYYEPSGGAARIYRREGTGWEFEARLVASDAAPNDQFGVCVSIEGEVAAVGADYAASPHAAASGAVYMVRFDGSSWHEESKLVAADAQDYDRFGVSVSVSGGRALVGAFGVDCASGADCGAAYLFQQDGGSWLQRAKLTARDAATEDFFGYSVSLDGQRAVIGAPLTDCAAGVNCGSSYVFRFDGSAWVEEAELAASDGHTNAAFGTAVAISGDLVLVGAEGSNTAYLFRRQSGAESLWVEEQKLVGSEVNPGNQHGETVAIRGNRAVFGGYRADCSGESVCGASYLYEFDGRTWVMKARLTPPDPGPFDAFGKSVALGDEFAVVGAEFDDCRGGSDCGAAYVFNLGPDCNENNVPDLCDIVDGQLPDTDGDGLLDDCENVPASMDIRPHACPNPFNPRSRGVIPVILLGSDKVDVRQIDVESLNLRRADGMGGAVSPLFDPPGPGVRFGDWGTALEGTVCQCPSAVPDRVEDLALTFSTAELADVLELGSIGEGDVLLVLSGHLADGTALEAFDCVSLVGVSIPPVNDNAVEKPAVPRTEVDRQSLSQSTERP